MTGSEASGEKGRGEVVEQVSMSERSYQICANCIMDTSDSTISFDERGWCDYCRNFRDNIEPNWHPGEEGVREITPLIEKIKREGASRDHDCLIGISGGRDSSYVTYVAKEQFGLRHGRGKINFEEIIRTLNRIGYDGPLSIEWEDGGMDREHGAAEACAYVKRIDFAPSAAAFDAAFAKEAQ